MKAKLNKIRKISFQLSIFCSLLILSACPNQPTVPDPAAIDDCDYFSVSITPPLGHIFAPRVGEIAGYTLYDFYSSTMPTQGTIEARRIEMNERLFTETSEDNEEFASHFIFGVNQNIDLFRNTNPEFLTQTLCQSQISYEVFSLSNPLLFASVYESGNIAELAAMIEEFSLTSTTMVDREGESGEIIEDIRNLRVGLVVPENFEMNESSVGYFGLFNFLHLVISENLYPFENLDEISAEVSFLRTQELEEFQSDLDAHRARNPFFADYNLPIRDYAQRPRIFSIASIYREQAATAEIYLRGLFALEAPISFIKMSTRNLNSFNHITLLAAKDWSIFDFLNTTKTRELSDFTFNITGSSPSIRHLKTTFKLGEKKIGLVVHEFIRGVTIGSFYTETTLPDGSQTWQLIDHEENTSISSRSSWWLNQTNQQAYFLKFSERDDVFDEEINHYDQVAKLSLAGGRPQFEIINLDLETLGSDYIELSQFTTILPAANPDAEFAIIYATHEGLYYWETGFVTPQRMDTIDLIGPREKIQAIITQNGQYFLFTEETVTLPGSDYNGYRLIRSYQLRINLKSEEELFTTDLINAYPMGLSTSNTDNLFDSLKHINDDYSFFHINKRNSFGLIHQGRILLPTETLETAPLKQGFFSIQNPADVNDRNAYFGDLIFDDREGLFYSPFNLFRPFHPRFYLSETAALSTHVALAMTSTTWLNALDYEFNEEDAILELNLLYQVGVVENSMSETTMQTMTLELDLSGM